MHPRNTQHQRYLLLSASDSPRSTVRPFGGPLFLATAIFSFLEIKLFLNMHLAHHYGALIYYPDKTPPSSSITLQSIWPCVTTDRSLPRWMIPTMTLADPLFACRLQRFIRHVAFSWNRLKLEIIVIFDHLGPCWPIWTLLKHFRQRWFFCPKWTK